MCGITGIYQLSEKQVLPEEIIDFNDSLKHRGPDGSGVTFHNDQTLALGHRRLSILDLSDAGSQPMNYADDQLTICFNGEVFNFIELREELELDGYSFTSNADTEVVLAAYHKWGKDCFHRFNGMWALAIWDNRTKELVLCRDRYGIKPLYYFHDKNGLFAFASELKAFKALKGMDVKVNRSHLDYTVKNGNGLENQGLTIFHNTYSLVAGHLMIVKKGDAIHQKRWYYPKMDTEISGFSKEDKIEQLTSLFEQSVGLRLRSDVPVATALSGGLDSSIVFGEIERLKKDKSQTRWNSLSNMAFSSISPGDKNDEREFAQEVVNFHAGSISYVNTGDSKDHFEQIIKETGINGVINSNPLHSISSLYSEMHKNGYRVSMDGHGVDELAFGYRTMLFDALDYSTSHFQLGNSKQIIDALVLLYPPKNREEARKRLADRGKWIHHVKKLGKKNNTPETAYGENFGQPLVFAPSLEGIACDYFYSRSLPEILTRFDLAAMSASVEVRMPFMDYRIVEFMQSLKFNDFVADGYTKNIVRKSFENILPPRIAKRTFKVGFQSPLQQWLNSGFDNACLQAMKEQSIGDYTIAGSQELDTLMKTGKEANWKQDSANQFWKVFTAALIERNYQ